MVNESPALPPNWKNVLQEILSPGHVDQILSHLKTVSASAEVFPPLSQIFRAFELCPFQAIKVVILGQDPYHAPGQAHGLCFSVNAGVRVPPSLKNIFKELSSDIPGFVTPPSGDLSGWAKQGVLLLNSVLSVQSGQPGSHRWLGWEQFTDDVIAAVSTLRNSVVFLLWGNYAMAKKRLIDESKHLVLTAPHPSPLARGGFFGCRHFSRTNNWLIQKGIAPVNWQL